MKYVQCTLRQNNTHQVAWIPQLGNNKVKVEVGKIVQLDNVEGWWEVLSVSIPKDGSEVKSRERNYKNFSTSTKKK